MRKATMISCLALLLSAFCQTTSAHEFLLRPTVFQCAPGDVVSFSVVSAHRFMVSEEMEPLAKVSVSLAGSPVKLAENPMLLTLDGQATPVASGDVYLVGHRAGVIWTQTTKGWVEGSKKGLTGVLSSGLYEKFAKALIVSGASDGAYAKPVGQRLEIVPVSDPSSLRPGDEATFRILLDGKPLGAEVFASYDGFSAHENTYAGYTECGGDGLAHIRITAPGVWMIRAQHKAPGKSEDYDTLVTRSTLTFEVR